MEIEPKQADETPAIDESSESAGAEAVRPASSHKARLSRLLDYQASSLEKDDPLEANLGSINSGLMRVALWLDETIEQAMESGPPNVERLSRILPAIDTHLRVTRQVDRFANIELRAAEARKPTSTDDHGEKVCVEAPSKSGSGESEDSGN